MSLDDLRNERNAKTVALTQFYEEYHSDEKNIVYGFVEGKDDPSLYRHMINSKLPEDAKIILYSVDAKKNVKYIYDQLDWNKYSKKQIGFFLDRDLSDLIADPYLLNDCNVYVTDKYSIENDICCAEVLDVIISEILGFPNVSRSIYKKINDIFEQQKKIYEIKMSFVMAHIIHWKRSNVSNPLYANIKPKNFCHIDSDGMIQFESDEDIVHNIYEKSKVSESYNNPDVISSIQNEIKLKGLTDKIVRGKYMTSFFVLFITWLCSDGVAEKIGLSKTKRGEVFGEGNAIRICAPRKRIIPSLCDFLQNTYLKHCI